MPEQKQSPLTGTYILQRGGLRVKLPDLLYLIRLSNITLIILFTFDIFWFPERRVQKEGAVHSIAAAKRARAREARVKQLNEAVHPNAVHNP